MKKNEGHSFGEVFCLVMGKCLKEVPVETQEREIFLAFAEGGSFADGQMQIRTIQRSVELLKSVSARLEQENREKCRMAVGLGVMSGLLLVVVLL